MENNFCSLSLLKEYRSPQNDVVQEFFLPVLSCTKIYKRSVGFFSSTSLVEITKGISELVKNGGKIQIVASPKLSDEDIEAIQKGYAKRNEVIEKKLLRELYEPQDCFEQKRLNLLANLIANGTLDLKIAFIDNGQNVGIYHEKLGVVEDFDGNKIAFDGSMNESITALRYNYENLNVYCGWKSEDAERIDIKIKAIENIWNNTDQELQVIEFPSIKQSILDKYKKADLTQDDFELDKEEFSNKHPLIKYAIPDNASDINSPDGKYETNEKNSTSNCPFFKFPEYIKPRPHQVLAIEKLCQNNFQCLFAMATGTGKTLTSLFAVNEICKSIDIKNILIIVPLKDLVDQWAEDIEKYFSGEVILVRSGLDWKTKIESRNLLKIISPSKKQDHCVVITTYDSFSGNDEKLLMSFSPESSIIIADEVHKFGAETYSQKLPEQLIYRIGLSATPKRPYDDKGTTAIFDYFCPSSNAYEFTIKQAIDADMLCHYNYYPILVSLTEDEMEAYEEISEKISRLSTYIENYGADSEEKKSLEQMLKQRHRIIERAENKKELFLDTMIEQVNKYKDKTIIFCPDGLDENGNDLLTQYKTELWKRLSENKKIIVMNEYVQGTKKEIIEKFTNGSIDMLFAKQRLNEGIDIPAAKRAFFIASSTSEREFIQRRGRVLRKSQGKTLAEIFDFIVVPPSRNYLNASKIVASELKRAMDFVKTADNYSAVEKILNQYL